MIPSKSKAIEKQSSGIKGGKREGAGRKAGVPNKRTAEIQAAVEESGLTPLAFMLDIMRAEELEPGTDPAILIAHKNMRFEAAKAAAPYVHAKLSSVEMNATVTTKTLAEELAELNAQSDATSH